MKKLFLIVFLLAGLSYSQSYSPSIRTVYGSTNFYADSVSQVLTLDKGLYLQGLLIPQGLTASMSFKVSNDGTTFYDLADSVGVFAYSIDSTKAIGLSLPGDAFKAWKYFKFITDNDRSDTTAVIPVLSNK